MSGRWMWALGKTLEFAGLIVVLAGLLMSMRLGFGEEGLKSMAAEFQGLGIGGGLFLLGYVIERSAGGR